MQAALRHGALSPATLKTEYGMQDRRWSSNGTIASAKAATARDWELHNPWRQGPMMLIMSTHMCTPGSDLKATAKGFVHNRACLMCSSGSNTRGPQVV